MGKDKNGILDRGYLITTRYKTRTSGAGIIEAKSDEVTAKKNYDHGLGLDASHREAMLALCKKRWPSHAVYLLAAARTETGIAWVVEVQQ